MILKVPFHPTALSRLKEWRLLKTVGEVADLNLKHAADGSRWGFSAVGLVAECDKIYI